MVLTCGSPGYLRGEELLTLLPIEEGFYPLPPLLIVLNEFLLSTCKDCAWTLLLSLLFSIFLPMIYRHFEAASNLALPVSSCQQIMLASSVLHQIWTFTKDVNFKLLNVEVQNGLFSSIRQALSKSSFQLYILTRICASHLELHPP